MKGFAVDCPEAWLRALGRRAHIVLVALAVLALPASAVAGPAQTKPAPVANTATAAPKGSLGGSNGPSGPPGGKVRLKAVHGLGVRDAAAKRRATTKRTARAAQSTTAADSALILYDTASQWGWLGQSYATMTANLASQFGGWTAKPVSQYVAGDVNRYKATIYIGAVYDEPLPAAFLAEVPASTKPVVWMYNNIWQLTARTADFQSRYGWMWSHYTSCATCAGSTSNVTSVEYKGRTIDRSPLNQAGIMDYASVDPAKATVLATAVRQDGTRFPWAVRSGNLTYVGEIPFSYFAEGDRMMVFADLLFDALAPQRPERHRALLRLEDITPESDPAELRAIADYLYARRIPFGFGVVPVHRDPNGVYNGGRPLTTKLKESKELVDALNYMRARGGTLVAHGYTHQYSNVKNPYNGVSGDDFEFYRTIENPDFTLTFQGPVAEDSTKWAGGRMDDAIKELAAAKFARPSIWEFPHYAASVVDYQVSATKFPTRWERSLYPLGSLTGARPDYTRVTGQFFPYVVRDIYGQKVLPENLGNVEPEPFHQFPVRMPADIIRDAERNLVVRDGFAAMYFHPFWDLEYLKTTVEGIQRLGYTFVSPTGL